MNKPSATSRFDRFSWLIFPIFMLTFVGGFLVYFLLGHPHVAVILWAGGSCPLVVGLVVEILRERPPDPRDGRRSVQRVGQLTVTKTGLVLADTIDLRNRLAVSEIPAGTYKVTAHLWTAGGRSVVSRVTLSMGGARISPLRTRALELGVGYGFVFAGTAEAADAEGRKVMLQRAVEQLVTDASSDLLPIRLLPAHAPPTGVLFLNDTGSCECVLTTDHAGNTEFIMTNE